MAAFSFLLLLLCACLFKSLSFQKIGIVLIIFYEVILMCINKFYKMIKYFIPLKVIVIINNILENGNEVISFTHNPAI